MHVKGMSTRDISAHLDDIYGIEASAEMISRITDRVLPEARAWQKRPLDSKYIVMFLDAIHYHVKEDSQVVKKAVYIAIGIRLDGTKEVMGMYIGGNESAKYWLGVLNDLKARGVQDILVCCVDGLSGFCDAIRSRLPSDGRPEVPNTPDTFIHALRRLQGHEELCLGSGENLQGEYPG